MSKYRVGNKVIVTKEEASLGQGLTIPSNTEIEVVMDVVYMQGVPVMQGMQNTILNWIATNPDSYTEKKTH